MTLNPTTDVLTFEAVKVAMRQDKNGHILVLSIHPNDIPNELFSDWLGSRYYVSLVKLNDDETPVPRRIESENRKLVQQAGILCREKPFQEFLTEKYVLEDSVDGIEEVIFVKCLRIAIGVKSRAELADNSDAQIKFKELIGEYNDWFLNNYNAEEKAE